MLATVLGWLTDFLTGAIMESRKAARSKAAASPPWFHCSTIRCSTIPPSRFFYFTIRCSTIPSWLFHCSIMIASLFHHQIFHCSTIRCSTVPPSDVPPFHHDCFTVPPSDFSLFHHLCSTFAPWGVRLFYHLCFTVPPSYVLLFHHLCSTVPPSDVLVFHHLCSTVPPRVFYYSTIKCLTLPPCLFLCFIMTSGTSIFGTSAFVKPQRHFVCSPCLGLAWQNLKKQARHSWFLTTFSFSKEIKRYLLSEQYSMVTWIEILLKPYVIMHASYCHWADGVNTL